MSDPFIGEIRIMAFTFAPKGWAQCNGQIIAIQQNSTLFAVLGVTYGGNGTSNFQLPNLQAQAAMGAGNGPGLTPRPLGETIGSTMVSLTADQMPQHTHVYNAGKTSIPAEQTASPAPGAYLGPSNPAKAYADTAANVVPFAVNAIAPNGGSQPHANVQPLLALNFCIALVGLFPQRN